MINSLTTLNQSASSPEEGKAYQNLEVGEDTRSIGEHFGQSESVRKPFQSTRHNADQLKLIKKKR